MRRRLPSARVLVLALASSGCGPCGSCAGAPANVAPSDAAADVAAARDAGLAAARCTVTSSAVLDADGEVGEAVATPAGFALGVTRRVGGQRLASVALVSDDLRDVAYVDLGPVYGDDPLPRPFSREGDLVVARFARSRDAGQERTTGRELQLSRIADKAATPIGAFPQPLDDSLSYDVVLSTAGGLVAWDEDGPREAGRGARGVIMVAPLSAALAPSGKAIAVSPELSDAESPRLAPRPGGYWVVWIARRPEAPASDAASEDAHGPEGPGEARVFQWLEAAQLDASGARVGEVRTLTPPTGHVTLFDLAPIGSELDVFFRDDAEPAEGAGGRIARARARADGVEAPVELVRAGVGGGAPEVIAGWLSYVDAAERAMLLPLGASHDPAAPPSDEPALEGGRLLAASRKEGGGLLSIAALREKKPEARKLRCTK
jgi:hypothetical protein